MSNSTYLHILTVFLDQSFTDFEIIFIDDVSLNSLEILNYFSKNNSLIKNNSIKQTCVRATAEIMDLKVKGQIFIIS